MTPVWTLNKPLSAVGHSSPNRRKHGFSSVRYSGMYFIRGTASVETKVLEYRNTTRRHQPRSYLSPFTRDAVLGLSSMGPLYLRFSTFFADLSAITLGL